jgi:hypothetical protein
MQIMRHADFSVTMETYTKVSSKSTRDGAKKLGDSWTDREPLYFAAVRVPKGPLSISKSGP